MPVRGGDFIALAQAVHRKSVSQSQFVEQCCSSVIADGRSLNTGHTCTDLVRHFGHFVQHYLTTWAWMVSWGSIQNNIPK